MFFPRRSARQGALASARKSRLCHKPPCVRRRGGWKTRFRDTKGGGTGLGAWQRKRGMENKSLGFRNELPRGCRVKQSFAEKWNSYISKRKKHSPPRDKERGRSTSPKGAEPPRAARGRWTWSQPTNLRQGQPTEVQTCHPAFRFSASYCNLGVTGLLDAEWPKTAFHRFRKRCPFA